MVERVQPILSPYKLVSREMQPDDTVVEIGGVPIGGGGFTVIAGPCAVESLEQFRATAAAVKAVGAPLLRGGAFKPRTSPYSFQGLGVEGLRYLQQVSEETGLPAITEVVEVADVEAVEKRAAGFQVGTRNMQNFRLLRALGRSRKPVVLKRGMAAKIDDLLLAAEYVLSEGNPNVVLCERGIKTFETATRNTLDLNAVPYIKKRSHLPVIVDPSHGTGVRELITPMALAAAACGADGILVEVHHDPPHALSDGQQSLTPEEFEELMHKLEPVVTAVNKEMTPCPSI
jgi:3-deoxy-7-phosphoheptulonate synthase